MLKMGNNSSKYNIGGTYQRRNIQRLGTPSQLDREEKIKSLLNSHSVRAENLDSNVRLNDI
jgi:hypothetical protein